MKIATWNVNGLRARHHEVCELAARHGPDVLCLQEIKASPAQVPHPLTTLPDYWNLWHGGPGGYSGVSLHLRRTGLEALRAPAAPHFASPAFDVEHRVVTAALGSWSFTSVYVPNGARSLSAKLRFLAALAAHVAEQHAAGRTLVVCGDLNVALAEDDVHPVHRKPEALCQSAAERALLREILAAGLVDAARHLHGGADGLYTWWPPWRNQKQRDRGMRLDYVLASAHAAAGLRSATVLRAFGTSDHAPVLVELEPP